MIDKTRLQEELAKTLLKEFSKMVFGVIDSKELSRKIPKKVMQEVLDATFGELTDEKLLEWINNPKGNPKYTIKALGKLVGIASDIYQARNN
ncbi:MAG: hypothetical protein Q7R78_01795 [bacterium]|nr:hypothetical protein [bacterium]